MSVVVAVGTMKGAFFLRADEARSEWQLHGPAHKGWIVNTFGRAPDGAYLLATGSTWYGAAVHRSSDLEEWEQVVDGPAYGEERKLNQIWTLHTQGDTVWAGVDEAGLFRSGDSGATWEPVTGLNEHETRERWEPGLGGLAAHRVLTDPSDPNRVWCGISAVGVFRSDDGGETWHPKNDGVPAAVQDDDHPDIGYCVHCLVNDPSNPGTIWRQDHLGVFRTTDGAETWERVESGLPANFGFPIERHHASGRLFVIPLESDQYRMPVNGDFAVYVSDDGGNSWYRTGVGLPDGSFTGVLRDAMACDQMDDAGVYFGTTGGVVHYSTDGGNEWHTMPWTFPRILSVQVFTD